MIHPNFWTILEQAKKGSNYTYQDSKGNTLTLYSNDKNGISTVTNEVNLIACYSHDSPEIGMLREVVSNDIQYLSALELPEMTIDVSSIFTPLCHIGVKYMTDKSHYNLLFHRHPYTAIYDMFLRKYKRKSNVKLGEIGILNGSSLRMWREYFPTATIHAFDIDDAAFTKIGDISHIHAHKMDASNVRDLTASLHRSITDGKKFDILIEDASHCLNHQLFFLRYCLDYVESGGIVIIEDIFRAIPVSRFQEMYRMLYDKIEYAVLIKPEHTYRYTSEWDNDRILVIWKS